MCLQIHICGYVFATCVKFRTQNYFFVLTTGGTWPTLKPLFQIEYVSKCCNKDVTTEYYEWQPAAFNSICYTCSNVSKSVSPKKPRWDSPQLNRRSGVGFQRKNLYVSDVNDVHTILLVERSFKYLSYLWKFRNAVFATVFWSKKKLLTQNPVHRKRHLATSSRSQYY